MIREAQGGYVRTEFHQGITTVEFHHPQGNSMPGRLLEELAFVIHGLGNDDDTKVIVLRSSGDKAFCAGASFDELSAIKTEAEGIKFFSGFAHVINAMRKCPQFIIGRIHAKCVGGGVGIAAAVDYAIASDTAEVKLSELAIAIGPFVVGPAVERKIGLSAYSQLAIDASHWRNADWARKKGLYAEVHESAENLDEAVNKLARTLASSSPVAMAELKKVFWRGTEHWDHFLIERAGISGKLVLSEHSKKAIERVRNKVS